MSEMKNKLEKNKNNKVRNGRKVVGKKGGGKTLYNNVVIKWCLAT